jgi:ATP-binding cassette subfamily B (MDR/TAP) protein 1
MGDGLVLEQGTHNQLLRDPDGPYSRLFTAQKLRDQRDIETKDSDSASGEAEAPKQKFGEDLVRKNTGHTLGSDIEGRIYPTSSENEQERGLFYLFMRMGKLNRAGWLKYVSGAIAASREFRLVLSDGDLTDRNSEWDGFSRIWDCLLPRSWCLLKS